MKGPRKFSKEELEQNRQEYENNLKQRIDNLEAGIRMIASNIEQRTSRLESELSDILRSKKLVPLVHTDKNIKRTYSLADIPMITGVRIFCAALEENPDIDPDEVENEIVQKNSEFERDVSVFMRHYTTLLHRRTMDLARLLDHTVVQDVIGQGWDKDVVLLFPEQTGDHIMRVRYDLSTGRPVDEYQTGLVSTLVHTEYGLSQIVEQEAEKTGATVYVVTHPRQTIPRKELASYVSFKLTAENVNRQFRANAVKSMFQGVRTHTSPHWQIGPDEEVPLIAFSEYDKSCPVCPKRDKGCPLYKKAKNFYDRHPPQKTPEGNWIN